MGGGNMVIHTVTKGDKLWFFIGVIMAIVTGCGLHEVGKEFFPFAGIGMMLFMIIVFAYYCIMLFRTLIMDEKGCTIRFFGKERYYTWEEFAIRRLEEHWIPVSRGHKKGYVVFFSVYPVEKAQNKNPIDYWRHHPLSMAMFSFHFALYKDEIYEPGNEESYFREKMKEWNVEMEEVRMRDWKKK